MTSIRTGQAPVLIGRAQFHERFSLLPSGYQPYHHSHDAPDKDTAVREAVRQVAVAVKDLRAGRLRKSGSRITPPRPKRLRDH